MTKYDYINIDITQEPNIWKCDRCGEKLLQPSNMRLGTASLMMEAFFKAHKKCKMVFV